MKIIGGGRKGDSTSATVEQFEKLDRQNREVKHDLRNVAFRADALRSLVSNMREDDTWRRGPTSS